MAGSRARSRRSTAQYKLARSQVFVPKPLGCKVGFLMDSIGQHSESATSGNNAVQGTDEGEVAFARALSPRYRVECWPSADGRGSRYFSGANHGLSGDTPSGALSRAGELAAMKPDIVHICIGGNGITDIANALACADFFIALGIFVVFWTVRPWGPNKSGDNAASRANLISINASIRAYCASKPASKCMLFDAYAVVLNPGTEYRYVADMFPDNIHPVGLGASRMGVALAALMDTLVAPGNWLKSNAWLSTNRQPALTGSVAVTGTGASGVVPTGYALARGSSGTTTYTASLEANATTGAQNVIVDCNPGSGNTNVNERFELKFGTGAVTDASVAGKFITAWVEVEYDASPMWGTANLQLLSGSDSSQINQSLASPIAPLNIIAGAKVLYIQTHPLLMPAGDTGYRLILQQRLNPSSQATVGRVKIRDLQVRICEDPKVVWQSGVIVAPPGQVTGVTLGAATTTTQPVSWTPPASGGAVTSYTLEQYSDAIGFWTTSASGLTTTSYTVTGLTAGTQYSYRVTAVGPGGGGTISATATGSTSSTALSITGTPPASATVGTAYSFTPTTSGGSGTKTFALTGTLPAGLSFSTTTGAITGTPTTVGTPTGLNISVTDGSGSASLGAFSIAVVAASTGTGNALLQEDGTYVLREDGTHFARES